MEHQDVFWYFLGLFSGWFFTCLTLAFDKYFDRLSEWSSRKLDQWRRYFRKGGRDG